MCGGGRSVDEGWFANRELRVNVLGADVGAFTGRNAGPSVIARETTAAGAILFAQHADVCLIRLTSSAGSSIEPLGAALAAAVDAHRIARWTLIITVAKARILLAEGIGTEVDVERDEFK